MHTIQCLLYGFSVAVEPENLLSCFIGVLLGTLIGVLPGIGAIGAISILLPITFHMSPIAAIIMLAGIYYGSMYGGSITSILVNIPGEAASVVTCFDGYEMAKQGRAGPALGIAAFGSFIAGTLGLVGLILFATPLSAFGLRFGAPEYFGLLILGMTLIITLSSGSLLKGFVMAAFGLILSTIGLDPISASPRMVFGRMELWDGVGLVPVAMGLFGITDILDNIEVTTARIILKTKMKSFFPTISDWMQSIGPILRGTALGFFIGILPGGNPPLVTFLSYGLEKRISKNPDKFGKGAIEGVAGPESSNNAVTSAAFIPFFTLGIPSTISMALLLGALMIHGIRPGPLLLTNHPDIFWGVVSSMYIGNVMLLVLNLPLIPMWVQVLKIPYWLLFPLILLFCIIGAYSLNNAVFDVIVMLTFGVVGYFFKKFQYECAPLLFAYVLGSMIEINLRHSLMFSQGSFQIFFTRPIAAVLVISAIILFITSMIFNLKKRRRPKSTT